MLTNLTAVEDALTDDILGAYPRWISLGQVSNPRETSMGETGAFIAYGDQERERDLGVADGFSGLVMGKEDAMVSREILDILGID